MKHMLLTPAYHLRRHVQSIDNLVDGEHADGINSCLTVY